MRWGMAMAMMVIIFLFLSGIILPGYTTPGISVGCCYKSDTAYINEQGEKLTEADPMAAEVIFIIKTCRPDTAIYTQEQIDQPISETDNRSFAADVKGISKDTAMLVEALIRGKETNSPLVIMNTVRVLRWSMLRSMLDSIKDDGNKGPSEKNNREYGAMIKRHSVIGKLEIGQLQDPCNQQKATVKLDGKGTEEFHSHPSGTMPTITSKGQSATCYFMQAPSRQDIDVISDRTGYVFGMSKKCIYIYNSSGVVATLPFGFVRK